MLTTPLTEYTVRERLTVRLPTPYVSEEGDLSLFRVRISRKLRDRYVMTEDDSGSGPLQLFTRDPGSGLYVPVQTVENTAIPHRDDSGIPLLLRVPETYEPLYGAHTQLLLENVVGSAEPARQTLGSLIRSVLVRDRT